MSKNIENNNGTSIELLVPYIDDVGSIRLKNCFLSAIEDRCMPYTILEEYLSDSINSRIKKFMRIPNVGKKTAIELNEIIEKYCKSKEKEQGIELISNSSIDQEPKNISVNGASEPVYKLKDRYSNLKPQDIDILERRFGINRNKGQTLEEIGEVYGVTRERIRQIECRALKKLRATHIIIVWEKYIDVNLDQVLDILFNGSMLISNPDRISGEFALAITVVHENVQMFLKSKAQRLDKYWVKPNVDILEVQSTKNRLLSCIHEQVSVPLSIIELAGAFEVNVNVVEAAVSALDGFKVYDGWLIKGNATSRKRRIVNILNLFHKKLIPSPVSIWQIKVAYWEYYDDTCSGRDLLLSLQEYREHFVNLHELGWVCLTLNIKNDTRETRLREYSEDIQDKLYQKPVKTGRGLANSVYELFENYGPMRLSDAADIFQQEYPNYAVSSMYPMLVYYAVFLRFAPGVIGIQAHRKDIIAVNQARRILLNTRDLDLYLYSRDAGPPKLHYPLWDSEMEKLWANWLDEHGDLSRLGALLSVSRIHNWSIDELEKDMWDSKQQQFDSTISVPQVRMFSKRFIDTEIIRTALAALSIHGFVNWMYLNQAIGWRIETTRVVLVLAVLIRIGIMKPTGAWNKSHIITEHGRFVLKTIFDRSIKPAHDEQKTVKYFLKEFVKSNNECGWAAVYDFNQLLNQISDVSEHQCDEAEGLDIEDLTIESEYEGFMGDTLRQLIED